MNAASVAKAGQRVQVEVLGGHVHAETAVHLAQQQRAGQRVEAHAGPNSGRSAAAPAARRRPVAAARICRSSPVIIRRRGALTRPGPARAARYPAGQLGPGLGHAVGRAGRLPSAPEPGRGQGQPQRHVPGVQHARDRQRPGPAADAADPASQASSASMTPRPIARHDIISSATVQVPSGPGPVDAAADHAVVAEPVPQPDTSTTVPVPGAAISARSAAAWCRRRPS